MKKNQKGFTLVELLAVMVILGIMMAIAMPNVTGILNKNRASTYVEDAKKLATTAEYKLRGSNTGLVKPGNGQCIVMNLAYLDNSEFEEPPYGGQYLKDQSYVVIKKNGDTYEYYVQLLEKLGEGKNYRGIPFMNSKELYKDAPTELVANVEPTEQTVIKMSTNAFVTGEDNSSKKTAVETAIGTSVVDCTGGIVHVYATE